MTEWNTLLQPDKGQSARHIHLVDAASFDDWLKSQTAATRAMLLAQGFKGKAGEVAILPAADKDGEEWGAVAGVKSTADLGAWCLAPAAANLPGGAYRLARAASDIPVSEILGAVDETVSAMHKGAGASGGASGSRAQSMTNRLWEGLSAHVYVFCISPVCRMW